MNRAFKFRLAPVLEQRERRERERQVRVAALERERLAAEEDLRACQSRIEATRADLRERLGATGGAGRVVVIPEVRAQAGAALHYEARARQAAIALSGAHQRLQRARADLLHAATERRAAELLRDRAYEEWRVQQARTDTRRTDEAAMQMHARSRLEMAEEIQSAGGEA